MADEKSKKRNFIEISSSGESESESSSPESGEDFSESTSDDDYDDEESDATVEWIDSEDEEEGECGRVGEDEYCVDKHDVESMCNRVIQIVRGRGDLQELKLVECKAYLRRHGLRLSGTKEECIERIKEHQRLKIGNGQTYYPRSSFTIDCTGDVCKGDVVLFNQKVHHNSNKTSGSWIPWRRTVAGRIVKESYGASKQQHTFTVEVLWSTGAKRLDPLTPLLIKGRNLYKMKTYRQCWKDERERLKVLDEKHKRGAAARTIRAMRSTKAVAKATNSSAHKGPKRHKHSHHIGPSGTRENKTRKKRHPNEWETSSAKNKKGQPRPNSKHIQTSSNSKLGYHSRNQNSLSRSNGVREFQGFPYDYPARIPYHFQSTLLPRDQVHHDFPSPRGFIPQIELPCSEIEKPFPKWREFSRGGYPHSRSSHVPRNSNYSSGLNPSLYSPSTDTYRWR